MVNEKENENSEQLEENEETATENSEEDLKEDSEKEESTEDDTGEEKKEEEQSKEVEEVKISQEDFNKFKMQERLLQKYAKEEKKEVKEKEVKSKSQEVIEALKKEYPGYKPEDIEVIASVARKMAVVETADTREQTQEQAQLAELNNFAKEVDLDEESVSKLKLAYLENENIRSYVNNKEVSFRDLYRIMDYDNMKESYETKIKDLEVKVANQGHQKEGFANKSGKSSKGKSSRNTNYNNTDFTDMGWDEFDKVQEEVQKNMNK